MNIAYVSADRGVPVFGAKGASIHLQEMVNAFGDLNHRVTVLAASRGDMPCPLKAKVIKVEADSSTPPTEISGDREKEKARVREVIAQRIGAAIQQRLEELHAKKRFDFIYERHSLWSHAGVRAARSLRIPCLVEVNAPLLDEQRRYRQLVLEAEAEKVESEVFARADVLLPVSEEVKAYALRRGARRDRTVVVPNGVDTKRFHPAVEPERVDGLNDRFIVGFTGSFKPWHGLDTLLETFRLLLERSAKYHLLLVGDGPLRSWIEGYIRGARLQKRVTITGWLPYKRLPSVIQRMAVAVAPFAANEEFYFSPLKLFEYMAVGKPVVASRLGQIERVIRPGVTGLLARPGDARDWADKIERLRRDLALRKKLGLAATQEAARHTWEQNARRVTACAEPLLRKR